MLFFGKKTDINAGVEECKSTSSAVLLDVRERDEYRGGHIPGAVNVPLSGLGAEISKAVSNKNAPLFVYCLSGARSKRATDMLKRLGYGQVKNIGGINAYKGPVER